MSCVHAQLLLLPLASGVEGGGGSSSELPAFFPGRHDHGCMTQFDLDCKAFHFECGPLGLSLCMHMYAPPAVGTTSAPLPPAHSPRPGGGAPASTSFAWPAPTVCQGPVGGTRTRRHALCCAYGVVGLSKGCVSAPGVPLPSTELLAGSRGSHPRHSPLPHLS